MKEISGSCLCKAVQLKFPVKERVFDACHCGMCRKWGGGPAMMVDASAGLKITGEDSVKVYESSDWAERGFCKNCGTHLFYRLKGRDFVNVPVGLLENVEDFKFHVQIYVDHKPKYYNFTEQTKMMTEAEVLAMFTQG